MVVGRARRLELHGNPVLQHWWCNVPQRGMSARSGDTMVCMTIQGTFAIVPWMPMMAVTLATR